MLNDREVTDHKSQTLHLVHQLGERGLGIAEEHAGFGLVKELVFDAGVSGFHAALHHDHLAGVFNF